MKTRLALLGLMTALSTAWACGPRCPVDVDNEQPKALRIMPGIVVKDNLAGQCDKVDWKEFSYFEDAKVTVKFLFGEMFKAHNLSAEITLYQVDGNVVGRQAVVPGKRDYQIEFAAKKDKPYYFYIKAISGKAAYMIETEIATLDACGGCTPGTTCCPNTQGSGGLCCNAGTVCREGACVRADECSDCGSDQVCESGKCVDACEGGCGRGKRCDVEKRRCVAVASDSPGPRNPPSDKPKGCSPACKGGETCNMSTLKCEAPASGGISGTVLSASEEGGMLVIQINRGSQDGVKNGASGSVAGIGFKVYNVTATRCNAKIKAKPDQVKPRSKVTINK